MSTTDTTTTPETGQPPQQRLTVLGPTAEQIERAGRIGHALATAGRDGRVPPHVTWPVARDLSSATILWVVMLNDQADDLPARPERPSERVMRTLDERGLLRRPGVTG